MMTQSVIHRVPPPTGWRVRRPWRLAVDVDGFPADTLAPVWIEHAVGTSGGRARLEWTSNSAGFGTARGLADRGASVRIRVERPTFAGAIDDWPVFVGHLVACRVEFDGQGRRVLLDAIDAGSHAHAGRRLIGRLALSAAGDVVDSPDQRLIFNETGRPNRSAGQTMLNGRRTYVFEPRPAAGAFWSVADAINYLLATRLAGDARGQLPTVERIESLCGDIRPAAMELTGRDVIDSIARLADLAGAAMAIEPRQSLRDGAGWKLRMFGPGGVRAVVMRHQQAGRPMYPAGTNLAGGLVEFDHDDARHVWIGLGEPERVESTFHLVAGWDPGLEDADHRTFTPANPDFHVVHDVHRRWVLNEAGDWTSAPFSRGPAADLSALLGEGQLLRPRPLEPCLSRNTSGQSFGVLVEVSYDEGESWQRYGGRIEVLSDEAGIRIADPELPPAYWQAARDGTLTVRVTATIESDRRLRVELEDPAHSDGLRTIEHLRHLPGRFRLQRVDATSRLAGTDNADTHDDSAALAAVLRSEMEQARTSATAGRLVLPWLSALYRPGDRVRGIAGQGLCFDAGAGREPLVRAVRHEMGESWQTVIELD